MTPGPPFPPPPTIGWPPGACPTLWRSSTRRRCTSPKAAVCRPRPRPKIELPPLNFLLPLLSIETASHCSISSRTPLQLHPPHLPAHNHHLQDSPDPQFELFTNKQTVHLYTLVHSYFVYARQDDLKGTSRYVFLFPHSLPHLLLLLSTLPFFFFLFFFVSLPFALHLVHCCYELLLVLLLPPPPPPQTKLTLMNLLYSMLLVLMMMMILMILVITLLRCLLNERVARAVFCVQKKLLLQ